MLNPFFCICGRANLMLVKYISGILTTHQNCIQYSCKFYFLQVRRWRKIYSLLLQELYIFYSALIFFIPFQNSTILKIEWTLLQKLVEKSSKNICWLYLKTIMIMPIILALSMTTSKCHCLHQRVYSIITKHRAFHQFSQWQFMLPLCIWIKFMRIILEWWKSVSLLEGISLTLQPSSKHLLWLTCICWFNLLLFKCSLALFRTDETEVEEIIQSKSVWHF